VHEDVHDKLAGACVFVPTACLCMKMYMTSWQVRVVPTACLCMKMYMTSWQVCVCVCVFVHEDVHDKLAGVCLCVFVPTACLCMKMYMTSWQVCECPRFSFGFDNAYCLTHLCVLLVCACELRNHNEVA